MTRIGAHLTDPDPLARAKAIGADAVQFFLGDPQDWKPPVLPADPAELRAAVEASGITAYVHAPYLVNVASANNRIRIPSRKILDQHLTAAASIGAAALIVHGGYVTAGIDPEVGYENWRKAVERVDRPLPLLIENTAGGEVAGRPGSGGPTSSRVGTAMARGLDGLARLWDAIAGAADQGSEIGFCLDTCHAFTSGEELAGIVDRVKAITGRIDLVHCNNSRDEFGSGRDRHAGLESGHIEPAQLLEVVRAAGATVICETPDPAADIRWLRAQLGG